MTTTKTVLGMLFAATICAFSTSHAQAQAYYTTAPILAEPELGDSLESIDCESNAATALYITASVSFGAGAVTALVAGFIAGVQNAAGGTDVTPAAATAITATVVAGLGLLTFIPAIILDVDSGIRRGRLQGGTRLGLGPSGVSLFGSF